MNKSLFALASGTLALGMAEFVIMAIFGNAADSHRGILVIRHVSQI